jgi:hypothetical protein
MEYICVKFFGIIEKGKISCPDNEGRLIQNKSKCRVTKPKDSHHNFD